MRVLIVLKHLTWRGSWGSNWNFQYLTKSFLKLFLGFQICFVLVEPRSSIKIWSDPDTWANGTRVRHTRRAFNLKTFEAEVSFRKRRLLSSWKFQRKLQKKRFKFWLNSFSENSRTWAMFEAQLMSSYTFRRQLNLTFEMRWVHLARSGRSRGSRGISAFFLDGPSLRSSADGRDFG